MAVPAVSSSKATWDENDFTIWTSETSYSLAEDIMPDELISQLKRLPIRKPPSLKTSSVCVSHRQPCGGGHSWRLPWYLIYMCECVVKAAPHAEILFILTGESCCRDVIQINCLRRQRERPYLLTSLAIAPYPSRSLKYSLRAPPQKSTHLAWPLLLQIAQIHTILHLFHPWSGN
uniref:Uncharacterized protein n=1 Tax=Peronospora matthiolae TaxID=2874970 RepID=A0AAV1U6T3_9STRA